MAPKSLTVTVHRCTGLRGAKGDNLTVLVRAEHGDTVLGESTKVECTSGTAEPNLSASLDCPPGMTTAAWLDSVLARPLVISCMEVMAKDKRGGSREDKLQVLGQSCVDLLEAVTQGGMHSTSVPVLPISAESPLAGVHAAVGSQQPAACDVDVGSEESLLDASWQGNANILRIRVDSLHSPPDPWATGATAQFSYCAVLPVPLGETDFQTVQFPNGLLKQPDKSSKKPVLRTWSNPHPAVGLCTQLPDSAVVKIPYEEEDGELRSPEDETRRRVVEEQKPSVVWHAERRCFLSPDAGELFAAQLRKHTLWPVEIVRIQTLQSAPKTKRLSAMAEEPQEKELSFHGVAYIDLAALLYPGVDRVRGAYPIHQFIEAELTDKTGQKGRAKATVQGAAPPIGERLKSAVGKKTMRSPSASKLHVESNVSLADHTMSTVTMTDGQLYANSRSYMMIEFCLQSPLIAKRTKSALAEHVAEHIPPRPAMPRYGGGGAEQAVSALHEQFNNVANAIITEFAKQFQDKLQSGMSEDALLSQADGMGKRLLAEELKPSGKYNAFKEQLRPIIVKVVREKFQHVAAFSDRTALQEFLPKLYDFLMNELHQCLRKREVVRNPVPVTQSPATPAQLLLFASEAESERDFSLADRFYKRCIAMEGSAPHWLSYAKFLLLCDQWQLAKESLKEAIAADQQHIPSLLLYGLVLAQTDQIETAELFFQRACCDNPDATAPTLMGLFYESSGNVVGKERSLREAARLHKEATASQQNEEDTPASGTATTNEGERAPDAESGESPPPSPTASQAGGGHPVVGIHIAPASPGNGGSPVQSVDTMPLEPPDGTHAADTGNEGGVTSQKLDESATAAQLGMSSMAAGDSQISLAPGSIGGSQTSLSKDGHTVSVTAAGLQQGSTTTLSMSNITAKNQRSSRKSPQTPSIFLRATDFTLACHVLPITGVALHHEHGAHGPSQAYFIAKARLHMQMKKFDDAKEFLQEALAYSYDNPCVWALLGHIHYLLGEQQEALSTYKRTLDLPRDTNQRHLVQLRLGKIYLDQRNYAEAKHIFLCACHELPSVRGWLGVGIACFHLGETDDADAALREANLLDNVDPLVWAYLSLISLRKGRRHEAELSFKYAMKTGLMDVDVLQELRVAQAKAGFGDPSKS